MEDSFLDPNQNVFRKLVADAATKCLRISRDTSPQFIEVRGGMISLLLGTTEAGTRLFTSQLVMEKRLSPAQMRFARCVRMELVGHQEFLAHYGPRGGLEMLGLPETEWLTFMLFYDKERAPKSRSPRKYRPAYIYRERDHYPDPPPHLVARSSS